MDNTSTEGSSSDYSTESSEDDGMETAQINGVKIQLPQGLCERQDIFREIFSTEVWNSLLDVHKQHLQTFLPNFPESDEEEKTKTLQKLFDFEVFRFNSPLAKFHDDLKAGYFRPDIARMRKIINKAEKKEAKYRYKTFREQLKLEVIESQTKLLAQIRNLPPGVEPRQEKKKSGVDYVSHRTKRRYYQTLSVIRAKIEDTGCSSDENYPDGPPISLSRKQKRHLNSIRNNLNNSKEVFFNSTMRDKQIGISVDLEKYITPYHNPFYINDESYKNLINQHKKRKLENPDDPELNTKGITVNDVVQRTQLPFNRNHIPAVSEIKLLSKKKVKKEHSNNKRSPENKVKVTYEQSSDSDSDSIDTVNSSKIKFKTSKQKLVSKSKKDALSLINTSFNSTTNSKINSYYDKITPVRVEDLDNIDVMSIPIDLEHSDMDIPDLNDKPELMQETHANFFSLIRDVICSTSEHRMNMYALQERLKTWQENPISPLNDWYSYVDNWISVLPSAITFLCGNASEQPDDFVPYMEYKANLDVYQWIGAGRDSDGLLSAICNFWLEHRNESKETSPGRIIKDGESDVSSIVDRSANNTPPPPRFPTTWTVRKATPEEIKDFREQERRRYDNPHKAFTYRCNDYESVVGPLKGIYNPAVGNNAKARGHTMLSADRPNFVTILSLVRDAAARLPNGEGTRAEICELLKSSQYISSTAPDNILQSVVSGALDRMHTQWDPCVKYDPKKKIWIYLHRNRTEEDFERIHQQYQGISKLKKTAPKKSPSKPKAKHVTEKLPKTKIEIINHSSSSNQEDSLRTTHKLITLQPEQHISKSITQNQEVNSNIVTVVAPTKGTTSVLLSNTLLKQQQESSLNQQHQNIEIINEEAQKNSEDKQTAEDKEVNEAIQAFIQNRVSSPTVKAGKSLVKILSPSPGKSLIIPASKPQLLKQVQERANTKQVNQVVTQQLLQTLAAQQKQLLAHKQSTIENADSIRDITKISGPIKNVTLLRSPIISSLNSVSNVHNTDTAAVPKDEIQTSTNLQIKTQGNLTTAQQQQLLQTIKQKILPNSGVLSSQQQIIVKQKGGVLQVQKHNTHATSQSVVAQQKIITENPVKTVSAAQGPVVAKVLTNAAGQVISVESLLAHQKQHGSLPQGTTLRVPGTKSGQQNIIQLTGTSKQNNALTQFTVGTQSNILTLTSQPKLVVATQATAVSVSSATRTTARAVNKTGTLTKFNAKTGILNTKVMTQGLETQKIIPSSKVVVQHQNQNKKLSKALTLNMAGGTNTIRMVNATNLNLTQIGGKPVLLASKGGTIQTVQGQNVLLQSPTNPAGGTSLLLQNTMKHSTTASQQQQTTVNNVNLISQSNLQNWVKMQQPQQVVFASGTSESKGGTQQQSQQSISQGHLVIGGHPVRLQTSSNAANATQRVVLASQGQGGQILAQQILLPAGFQGTAINIKSLQGVKVIPLAQPQGSSQGKAVQNRQVFARVMSPTVVKQTNQPATQIPEKGAEVTLPSLSRE